MEFHPEFGFFDGVPPRLFVEFVGVGGEENPAAKTLEFGMRVDGFEEELGDAFSAVFGQDEDVS
jgi:hypothetical protein